MRSSNGNDEQGENMDEEDEAQEVGEDIEGTSEKHWQRRQKTFVAHEKRSAACS